jgi:RHS repeat-associated protein
MKWEFATPLPHTNSPPTRTMTYDADNQLVSVDGYNVTVDLDGNLTSGPLTNDTFAAYTYDARNRLLNVGGVTNAYDAANNRIGQTYGTNSVVYVVNPNARLPQVLMQIKNGVTNYYIYGAGLLYQITETATATNTLTYHYDYRGSTIALTSDSGIAVDRFEYSLYATLTYRTGTNDTPFLFNGRYAVQTDGNGLLYMRARYYNPYLCRFLNPDPLGFSGGMNFYAYANGNPVSYLDPFGLFSWGKIAQGSLEVVGGVLAAVLVGLAEAPSAGTITAAAPTIFLGITHGIATIGVGLQPTPATPQQQQFLDVYPSGPGQLIGMSGYVFGPSVGQQTEKIGGLVWDVGSLGTSEFGLLNSFVNGEELALPATQFGVNGASVFSDFWGVSQPFFQNPSTVPNINNNNLFNLPPEAQPLMPNFDAQGSSPAIFPNLFNQNSSTGK